MLLLTSGLQRLLPRLNRTTFRSWAEFAMQLQCRDAMCRSKLSLKQLDELTKVSVDQLGATLELTQRTETGSGTSGNAVTFEPMRFTKPHGSHHANEPRSGWFCNFD